MRMKSLYKSIDKCLIAGLIVGLVYLPLYYIFFIPTHFIRLPLWLKYVAMFANYPGIWLLDKVVYPALAGRSINHAHFLYIELPLSGAVIYGLCTSSVLLIIRLIGHRK